MHSVQHDKINLNFIQIGLKAETVKSVFHILSDWGSFVFAKYCDYTHMQCFDAVLSIHCAAYKNSYGKYCY